MPKLRDQIGQLVQLDSIPTRIVSVVPSQTELLCDLGLKDAIVGITKFCVHPINLKSQKQVVGGTKNLNTETIAKLCPDLILANKEENTQKDIAVLKKRIPVYVSNVENLDDVYGFVRDLGLLTEKNTEASMLIERLEFAYAELHKIAMNLSPKKAIYLIWKDPYMAAGADTFISKMMEYCGITNALADENEEQFRYPKLEIEEIKNLNPDIVLFSSEPFPFKPEHIRSLENETGLRGLYVDGEIFSWYGSRILHLLDKTKTTVHEIDRHCR